MTPKQISKEFTDGLRDLGLSDGQVRRVVVLAKFLLNNTIPLDPIEQVEKRATKAMKEKQ